MRKKKWDGKGEINERKNRKWKNTRKWKKKKAKRTKCKENHNDNVKMIGYGK